MVTKIHRAAAPVLLALTVAILFGQSAFFGFAYDDHAIIGSNASLGDWGTVWQAVTHDLFYNSQVRPSPFWRPLVTISYYFDATIASGPMVGHLTNLVLAWALAWSFFRFLVGIGLSATVALSGAILLICHPVIVEPVVNITSRTDLMAALLSILALSSRRSRAIFVFTLLALMSKEVAIILPILSLSLGRIRGTKSSAAAVVVYLILRSAASITGGIGAVSFTSTHVIEAGAVAWQQLWFTLVPSASVVGQSLPNFGLGVSLLGWVAILVMTGACTLRWAKLPLLVRLGVTTIVPSILLVSGVTGSPPRVGDGLLLFPVLGVLFLMLAALSVLSQRLRAAATASILCLFVWSGAGAAAAWRDDVTLWEYAYSKSPNDPMIRLNYARSIVDSQPEVVGALLGSLDFADTRKAREAAEILARAHFNLGNDSDALFYLLDAVGDDIEAKWANSMACLVTSRELMSEAEDVCRVAFLTDPFDGGLRNSLGVYYGRLGTADLALTQFEAAVVLAPDEAAYLGNLQNARASVGQDFSH